MHPGLLLSWPKCSHCSSITVKGYKDCRVGQRTTPNNNSICVLGTSRFVQCWWQMLPSTMYMAHVPLLLNNLVNWLLPMVGHSQATHTHFIDVLIIVSLIESSSHLVRHQIGKRRQSALHCSVCRMHCVQWSPKSTWSPLLTWYILIGIGTVVGLELLCLWLGLSCVSASL